MQGGGLTCRLCVAFAFLTGLLTGLLLNRLPSPFHPKPRRAHIYWSEEVESMVPRGFSPEDDSDWRSVCRNWTVVSARTDGQCGRNKRVKFQDNNTFACVRQRNNVDQIQGDIMSFYLARTLGIRHLPPSALSLPKDGQWIRVKGQLGQWREDKPVVITRFVPGLRPANIPKILRSNTRRLHPGDLTDLSPSELKELVQWSDLIVFDYLTANLDRVVNNLYNRQWNSDMMDAPAHNLVRSEGSGLLLFLDNESGLIHGYRLLDKYESYHRAFLSALCVFRKSTADVIQRLHRHGNAGRVVQRAFEEGEGLMADSLPPLPSKSHKILQERIGHVHGHITWCEQQYLSR